MFRPVSSRSKRISDPKQVYDGLDTVSLQAALGQSAALDHSLRNGENANAIERDGDRVPLHWAAARGHLKCVELLLAAGAYPTAVDGSGRTAANLAMEFGHQSVWAALVADGSSGQKAKAPMPPALISSPCNSVHGGSNFLTADFLRPGSSPAKVMPYPMMPRGEIESISSNTTSRAQTPSSSEHSGEHAFPLHFSAGSDEASRRER